MDTTTPKLDTPADYTLWKLDQDIAYQTKRIHDTFAAIREEVIRADVRLREGGIPNTCGVLQSRNTELDMAVARLDVLKDTRNTMNAAMEFVKEKAQKPDALVDAAQDIIEGWDGLTRGGMVEVDVDDIKALRDALLARDAKPTAEVK